ncbi:hypothetical protein AVEN_56790-1 [Araneus ventricosus]|uniref:Uncharacterized protein n=1 Tax=Araneus ventricosus TaxID=182803 RepID=A0A4Y2H7R7_ARAVE|nr:hypothetical protein AVEN_56790-1 [Araneus ventricosus]
MWRLLTSASVTAELCEIQVSSLSDLELWANLQETDEELRSILESNAKFSGNLVKVQMPDVARSLYADNSTGINRFYVPLQLDLQRKIHFFQLAASESFIGFRRLKYLLDLPWSRELKPLDIRHFSRSNWAGCAPHSTRNS